MGKGSKRRPTLVSKQEENIRWKLKEGKITFKEFERKMKLLLKEKK